MKKIVFIFLILAPTTGGLYWLLLDRGEDSPPKATVDIEPKDRRQRNDSAPAAMPKAEAPVKPETPTNAETPNARPSQAAIVEPPPPPATKPKLVNSYDPILAYRIDLWARQDYAVGYIDSVRVDGPSPHPVNTRPLKPDDVLSLNGWAGHPRFGLQMRSILFTLCDLVIGAADISSERPDVAATIHPNLARSGWSARLAVTHFPDCDKPTLGAWAVAPTGTLAWPLIGAVPLKLPAPPRQPTGNYVSTVAPVTPEGADPPRIWTFAVRAKVVNLRQCGDTKYAVVGRIPTGTHKAFFSGRAGDWVLLQFSDATGWVAERLLTIQKDEEAPQ